MEEKKTIFDYLAQVMIIFGFAMLVLNIFCLIFGNAAKDISAIFELGDQGIPVGITLQFLCISALVTGLRFVFFTDMIIKTAIIITIEVNMQIVRSQTGILCMITSVKNTKRTPVNRKERHKNCNAIPTGIP